MLEIAHSKLITNLPH